MNRLQIQTTNRLFNLIKTKTWDDLKLEVEAEQIMKFCQLLDLRQITELLKEGLKFKDIINCDVLALNDMQYDAEQSVKSELDSLNNDE